MINVTLTFSGLPELMTFFTSIQAPASGVKVSPAVEQASVPAELIQAVVTASEAPGKPAKAAKPAPAPVAAPAPAIAAPAEAPAPAAAPEVEYAVLQKAVFALAGRSREAAAAIAAHFGVKTFKELEAARWGDALEAVNERLAIVEAG